MKKLVLILALVIPPPAFADRTYDVKATHPALEHSQTCDSLSRMLNDKHRLTIKDDGRVFINGMQWDVVEDEPNLFITFHKRLGQLTWLAMDLYVNQRGLTGRYLIVGITLKREPCFDIVYVDGNIHP
jgi:hypothetical protein